MLRGAGARRVPHQAGDAVADSRLHQPHPAHPRMLHGRPQRVVRGGRGSAPLCRRRAAHDDLLYTALLPLPQFRCPAGAPTSRLRGAPTRIRPCEAVLIRKNQGRESGASQPHVHNQVIGSDQPFAAVARERAASRRRNPACGATSSPSSRDQRFLLEERDGCCRYFCPFGVFPRSYEIVCLRRRVRMIDLPGAAIGTPSPRCSMTCSRVARPAAARLRDPRRARRAAARPRQRPALPLLEHRRHAEPARSTLTRVTPCGLGARARRCANERKQGSRVIDNTVHLA